jgi:peptide/nickel transport system substrate-binding protein
MTNKQIDSAAIKAFTALVLMAVLLTGACVADGTESGAETTPTAQGAPSPTIMVALAQAPVSLDPADHRDRTSETVIRNMFDGLVTRDTRNTVYLELAREMNWLDERTLEVRLREGVLFHDGVEMTADDVVFTFERIIEPDGIEYPTPHPSPRQSLVGPLKSVEKTDAYTVLMHFSDPWPVAMQMLVHQQIVPRHYLEEVGTEGFIKHPIGTGPFKFVSATTDLKQIVMERFDAYYGGAPGLPPVGPACVERATFRVISDPSTRAAALLIGEVDLIQGVTLDFVDTLDENVQIQIKTAPGTQPKWAELNILRPPFDDLRVRQALNYALDKERMIETVYGGRAVPLPGPLSPFNNFVNRSLKPYPYDPERALALLAASGWVDSDGDGWLDREGEEMAFTLDTLVEWFPLAEAVAAQLKQIGVEVTVRTWDPTIIRPELLAGRRVAYLDDWGDSAFDPVGHIEAKWHGKALATDPQEVFGRANYSGFNNERVNELIRLGAITSDASERQEIYDEVQQIIYTEAPALFLVLPEEIEAASQRVRNWEPASDSRINLHDVCIEP